MNMIDIAREVEFIFIPVCNPPDNLCRSREFGEIGFLIENLLSPGT